MRKPDQFQLEAVKFALKNMFDSETFYVTTVDTCLTILGAQRNHDYEALRLYHCVNWRDMPPGMPQQIADRILRMCLSSYIDSEKVDLLFETYGTIAVENAQLVMSAEEIKSKNEELEKKVEELSRRRTWVQALLGYTKEKA